MAKSDIDKYYKAFWRGSIDYIRVDKIDDEEARQLVYGTVCVTDCDDNKIVYHRPSVKAESKASGDYLSLSGPVEGIIAAAWFSISVTLWVKLGDRRKEIANGEVCWDPYVSDYEYPSGKPLEQHVLGRHGSVTLGFSTIQKALAATINKVVLMNELPAQIYGTIKAYRFLSSVESTSSGESSGVSSPMEWMLFDKSANECVQVNPGQSIPLTRPFFPVPVDSYLTIAVELWNHANDQIAVGSVQFTPKYGTKIMNITGGKVQVSITFN